MRTGSLSITGAQVWDGDGFAARDVHIVDGRVAESAARDARQLDARGKWLVPGLIDAHFHAYATSMDGLENERGPLSYAAINGAGRLTKALRRGFTTVRGVAGGDIGLARAIDADLFPSPRYHFTGPALSQTGGHGDPRSAHVDVCFSHGHMCEVVVDEATRRGSYVCAHAYSSEAVQHAIAAGVRSIEHGNLIDAETARLMAEAGAFLVPTLAAYDAMDRRGAEIGLNETSLAKNSEVLAKGQDAVRLAHEAGVRVGFGTDLMGDLEDDQLAGIRLQVEASGAAATLRSMTAVNAELIGDEALGHLNPGAYGDAVLLASDPLADPSALWTQDARSAVVRTGLVT